jgi:hypothetical protein
MNKRTLATFLWFSVGWAFGAMATFFLGLPDGLNIALATTVAAVVWWDPTHQLWPARQHTEGSDRTAERPAGPRLAAD